MSARVCLMNEYASIEETKRRLMNAISADAENDLNIIRQAASRAIDNYLRVSDGYFTPQESASTRRVKGTGSSSILLPAPLSGQVTIEAATGVSIPDYDVEGMRLVTLDTSGNPSSYIVWPRVYFQISGIWGYIDIPPQIKEACLQLIVHFWRGRDKGFGGIVTDMQTATDFPERDYPRATRRLLDEFAGNFSAQPSGGFYIA